MPRPVGNCCKDDMLGALTPVVSGRAKLFGRSKVELFGIRAGENVAP
jgi:hypothetical protein